MMIDGLIIRLTLDTGVAALIGGRVYENVLPRGYTLPAVAVHAYGGTQETQMSGPVDVRVDQVQFDSYGLTAASARAVIEAIRSALISFTGALPEGTFVQLITIDRSMAMEFKATEDAKGSTHRFLLGVEVTSLA
jgi:hypothetical protein